MKQSFGTDNKSVPCFADKTAFTGATDTFTKRFVAKQKEIAEVFEKDPDSDWIAGYLPKNWSERLKAKTEEERNEITKKIFLSFRAAVKHLKPYNAPPRSKEFSQHKVDLENKRVKETSKFLTNALRHFGVLPETNTLHLKRRKVHGDYIERGYVLYEKGKNPSLEKLFIKTFKKINPLSIEADFNGIYAEPAHWLNLNKLDCKYLSKVYWGDVKAKFMATEYETPPKFYSPIVQFKNTYDTLFSFAKDFYKQTGIRLSELLELGINPGTLDKKGKFKPKSKEELIIGYLQSVLEKAGLYHCDLHKDNAVIGTDKNGRPIVKIIDIGGIMKR